MFLITRPQDAVPTLRTQSTGLGLKAIYNAAARIYAEGGLLAFWIGNGIAVTKIFPESATRFYSYESSVSPLLALTMRFPSDVSMTETAIREVLGWRTGREGYQRR